MKVLLLIVMFGFAAMSSSGIGTYDELVSATIQACNAPQILLTTSFTNEVKGYRASCADAQGQCAADLALAISLMHRMDHDETVFRLNAAIWLAEHNRTAEIVGLTNSLPSSAIGIFLDEIK